MWLLFLLVTLIIGFAPGCAKSRKTSKAYCIFIFSVLGFLMMFRGINVGNDTHTYHILFQLFSTKSSYAIEQTDYELGFIYLCKLLYLIWTDPQILFIVTGAFIAFSMGRFIHRYSIIPWLSALMFLTIQFFDLSMSGIRQMLSISILTYAFDCIVSRKPIRFTLLVFLASLFHGSALVFLLIYPLSRLKIGSNMIGAGLLIAFIVLLTFQTVIGLIGNLLPAYQKYFMAGSTSYSIDPNLATSLTLAFWSLLFLISYMITHKPTDLQRQVALDRAQHSGVLYSERIDNIQAICVFLTIIMLLWSLQGTILTRFKYIYSFALLVYYPNALVHIRDTKTRRALIMGSGVIFIAYILVIYVFRPEWQSTFPYQFFWR